MTGFPIKLDNEVFSNGSIFDNQIIEEDINPYSVFDILSTSKLINFDSNRYKSGIGSLYPTEKELLKQYLFNYIPELDIIASSFYLPKHGWGRILPTDYLSMSVFHRPTRHTLCKDKYVDIDIVNCHYSIINQLMLEHNYTNKTINLYCSDPKGFREQVVKYYGCSKDASKQLFIRIIYGGTIDQWKKDFNICNIQPFKLIVDIEIELQPFRKLIFNENPQIVLDVKKCNPTKFSNKTDLQIINSVVAYWCQSVERYIQEQAILFIVKEFNVELKTVIPCQDGFMIQKKDYKINMIEAINQSIKTTTGLNIIFVDKPFDESYFVKKSSDKFNPIVLTDIQDADFAETFASVCYDNKPIITTGNDHLETYYYNGIYWNISPLHNADLFKSNFNNLSDWYKTKINKKIKILNNYLINNSQFSKANIKSAIKTKKDTDKTNKDINKAIDKINNLSKKQNGELTTSQLEEITSLQSKVKRCITIIDDAEDDAEDDTTKIEMYESICESVDLLSRSNYKSLGSNRRREDVIKVFKKNQYVANIEWNRNKKLFVFEDKVYNCDTCLFQETTEMTDYINQSSGWNYNIKNLNSLELEEAKTEVIGFIKTICLDIDYDFLMKYLSSFLEGENKHQIAMFFLGKGRNGKGTLCDLLRSVLKNYWGELDMGYYTNHSKDVDRPNQNLYNCRNANVLNTSEINDTNSFGSSVKFISSIFKGLSGQDPIYAREVGSKNTSSFIAGKPLISSQVMPSFSKMDIAIRERVVIMNFPYTFTSDISKINENPDLYKLKNVELKEKFGRPLYKRAFMDLLLEYYPRYKTDFIKTDSIKGYTQSYFNGESIKSYIDTYYTKMESSSVLLEDLKRDYNSFSGKHISIKLLREELNDLDYITTDKRLSMYKRNDEVEQD